MAPGWALPFSYFPSHKLLSNLELVFYHFCYSACSKTVGILGQPIVFTQAHCRSSGKQGRAGLGMAFPLDGEGGPSGQEWEASRSPKHSGDSQSSRQASMVLELIETRLLGPTSLDPTGVGPSNRSEKHKCSSLQC